MASTSISCAGLFVGLLLMASAGTADQAECATRVLMLAPCLPYVQGMFPSPARACCDGLARLNNEDPKCICVLLQEGSSMMAGFPAVNQTLALNLPILCQLHVDISRCPELLGAAQNGTQGQSAAVSPTGALPPFAMSTPIRHAPPSSSSQIQATSWTLIFTAGAYMLLELMS
ncbi:hypothetical protein AMTRI_Chr04g250490 [Amborella trichopoda]|uniref:Bifunctional inhibitor/plant lipid transfer protein/seed storage helical domain-containing protein n=1 Tax=Amborella trichopoda TaxID=13333 RepID=W1P203_AMBTC|nr:protein YLS3 [Amborella trichopoda]ERN00985.1 hypothetical protein AMTR_s00002p00104040 [Amborella trichopoda]|eukprot:XP_006838416.1 protein YLS3 [Amborella trichopoda]